jgi:hypothetical protein
VGIAMPLVKIFGIYVLDNITGKRYTCKLKWPTLEAMWNSKKSIIPLFISYNIVSYLYDFNVPNIISMYAGP